MAELRADPRAADPRWQAMTDNLGRAFAELDLEGDGNKHAVALSDCLSIVARERSQKFCKRRCNSPSLKRPDLTPPAQYWESYIDCFIVQILCVLASSRKPARASDLLMARAP